jgi:hypothetical protein
VYSLVMVTLVSGIPISTMGRGKSEMPLTNRGNPVWWVREKRWSLSLRRILRMAGGPHGDGPHRGYHMELNKRRQAHERGPGCQCQRYLWERRSWPLKILRAGQEVFPSPPLMLSPTATSPSEVVPFIPPSS